MKSKGSSQYLLRLFYSAKGIKKRKWTFKSRKLFQLSPTPILLAKFQCTTHPSVSSLSFSSSSSSSSSLLFMHECLFSYKPNMTSLCFCCRCRNLCFCCRCRNLCFCCRCRNLCFCCRCRNLCFCCRCRNLCFCCFCHNSKSLSLQKGPVCIIRNQIERLQYRPKSVSVYHSV